MVNITTAVANNNGMGILTGGQNVLYVTPISSGTDSSNGSQNLVKVINLIPISNCNTTHHHTVTNSGTNTLTTTSTQKPFITTTTTATTNTNSQVTTANPTVIQSSSYSLTKPTILTTVVSKNASSASPSLVTTMLNNKKATLPQLVNLPSGEKKQVIKLTRVEPQRLVNLVGNTNGITTTSGNTNSMPMNAPKVINLFSRGSTTNQVQQHHVDSNQPKIIMSQPVMTNLPQISQSAISPIRVENDRQDQNQVVINMNSQTNSQMDALLSKSPFVVRASNDQLVDSVVIAGGPPSSITARTFFDDELPIELHPKQFFESQPQPQPQPQSQVVSVTSTNANTTKNNFSSNTTEVRSNNTSYIQQNSCMQPLQVQTDLQHFKTNNTIMNSNAKQVSRQPAVSYNQSSILKPVGSHSPSFNPNHISHLLTQEIKPNNNIYSTGVVQHHSNQHHSNAVKRPVNAFILWSQQERRKLTESGVLLSENESNTIGTVSKRLGLKWRLMSKEEKQPYVLEAERLKQAHRIQHPDYKFSRGSSSTSSSSRNKRPKHSTESSLVTSSASSLNAGDDCYSYPQPSPYSIHSSSDQLNSIESGSTVDVDDLDISNFEFDSAGFENLMNAFEFNQPNTSTGGGGCGGGDGGFADLENLLLPITTSCYETMPQSKQASIPQEPVVIDSEPINQNNINTTIKPNMLDNSFIAITPPVDNDIIPMEDFLRSKKRRVCRSTKSRHLLTHVTSLNLIPHQGEKKLSSRAQLRQQSKPGQQMHVIPIGQNPKLREITEALIKQQKTPVQPGQNLICSIDPNTLQILLSHVNQQLSTTTTSQEQQQQQQQQYMQNNLDEMDLSYDWEVNRASLVDMWKLRIAAEEPPHVETVKQSEPPCMLNVDVSKPMLCEGFLTPSSLMDEQQQRQHQSDVNFSSLPTFTDPNMNAPIDFTQHDLTSEAGYLDMWNMVNVIDDTSSSLIYF